MSENSTQSPNQTDARLQQVLEDLLHRNDDITARAVARLHPDISHASTITRSPFRAGLLAQYQEKQRDIRRHMGRIAKRSKEKTATDLAEKDQRIAELERQVEILRASHVAMIRAVGELGGMSKWLKFFEGFKDARDQLHKLGAMSVGSITNPPAPITPIHLS